MSKLMTCVLLAMMLVVPIVPGVLIENVTTTEITLATTASCDYRVVINHVPSGDECTYWDGAWVIKGSDFVTVTVRWEDAGLPVPAYGKACVWWYCYHNDSMPHGTVETHIPGGLYLPLVMR